MSFEVDRKTGLKFKRVLKVGMATGAILTAIVMLIILLIVVKSKNSNHKEEVAGLKKEITQLQEELEVKNKKIPDAAEQLVSNEDDWCLALVNQDHPLDEEYVPTLVELIDDLEVDERIVDDAKQMLEDAEDAGLEMVVCSAYRSYKKQRENFNDDMETWVNSGYTMLEAYETTSKSIAVPGYSEHSMGLALDIVSKSYQELDEEQEDTEEAQWLKEHCWEYGFILRYPVKATDITGIIYEPWHYRYVGKDAAKEIMEKGITLEEYLGAIEE